MNWTTYNKSLKKLITIGCRTGYKIAKYTIRDKLLIYIYILIDLPSPNKKKSTPNIFDTQSVVTYET